MVKINDNGRKFGNLIVGLKKVSARFQLENWSPPARLGSARNIHSSGSLEPENSSSNPSLADFQWQFDVLTLKVILEHAVFECTMGPRHSEIEFRLLKFIYSEKALLSNNYIFANFGIKPTLIWYCLVGQTVYLSSFKHLSSKHCNLFYILEIYMRICNWPWLIVNALFLDDLGNATGKNIGLACKYQAISKLVYLKKRNAKM